jgi:hypothetical protein
MKVLAIGAFFEHEFVDTCDFSSTNSFLDYDIVLIDFRYILNEYKANRSGDGTYKGYKCLSDEDSVAIVEDIERRKLEISELLKLGRTVIVYLPSAQICYIDTGEREYSGTGKNRHTTRIVKDIDLLSVLPVKFRTVEATGTNIDFRGEEPFSAFWNINKKYLSFASYYQETIGKPLWFLKGTDRVVGSYLPFEKGNIIFMPTYSNDDEDEKREKKFFQSIITLVEELNKSTGDFVLPTWSVDYLMPKEDIEQSNLKKYELELKKIINKISKQKKIIAELEEYKILFSGTGRALEIQIGKVLSELGFEVTEGLPGRDDLILKYKDKVAVVEVKGASKSAAEKHAAQLEKWVSEYISKNGIAPKGILIVNAFKDIPLADRNEETFPKQMIKYSKNRNHCLLTGIQLLGLYLDCKANPEKRDEVIERIYSTDGLFMEYPDWTGYIITKDQLLEDGTRK